MSHICTLLITFQDLNDLVLHYLSYFNIKTPDLYFTYISSNFKQLYTLVMP